MPSASAPARAPAPALVRSARAAAGLLRSWPAVWAVVGSWLVLAHLFAYVFPYLTYRTGADGLPSGPAARSVLAAELAPARAPDVAVQAMPLFGGAMMTVLGVLVVGGAFTWGSWTTAATHTVPRRALVGGAVLAATVLTAGLVVVVLLLCLATSVALAAAEGLDGTVAGWHAWAGRGVTGFAVLEMWLLLGCALGVVFRGTGAPLGLALVWTLVVENLLRGVALLLPWLSGLTDLLPGTAAGSLVGAVSAAPLGEVTPGLLDDVGGVRAAVTVAVVALGCLAVTLEVFTRRDLT